jgi:hypothetical protein
LKKGEVGICIQTFIAKSSQGVPSFASNNRTFSSSGGSYKTSDRFAVNPTSGAVSEGAQDVGATGPIPGIGFVAHGSGGQRGATTAVGAVANARTASPWPPFNINYSLVVRVDADGGVSVSGSHDGYPSYEVWAYRDSQEPELVYKYEEGSVLELRGSGDVKIK